MCDLFTQTVFEPLWCEKSYLITRPPGRSSEKEKFNTFLYKLYKLKSFSFLDEGSVSWYQ